MCSIRDWGRYCASTIKSKMPEFTQFDNGKSMMRYLPAKGTAGLARLAVSTPRREPSPPARMTALILIVHLNLRGVRCYLPYDKARLFHSLALYMTPDISVQNWPTRNPAPCLLAGVSSSVSDPDI